MKKQYLSILLFLALILATFSSVSAQDVRLDTSVEHGAVQVETRTRVKTDLRAVYEAQRTQMEAQREKVRVEAEARRKSAAARGDETQARREAVRLDVEASRAKKDERREAARVEAESRRVEARAKRVEFQQAAAKRQVANTARVISAIIERLEKIIIRLESRIVKVQAQGGVTAESEGFVAAARVNLSEARLAVSAFTSIDLRSEEARENFQRIRAAAAEAREHVRAAHRNLMMAARSLGSVEANVEVTSTSEQ